MPLPPPFAWYAPEALLTLWGLGLLLAEAFQGLSPRAAMRWALAGLALAALLVVPLGGAPGLFWNGQGLWDGAARFFDLFFLATAALVIWMGHEGYETPDHGAEFAVLPLFTTVGLMLLASANDFILLFVALELVTISLYVLIAYRKRDGAALEAGVKYLILGGLSSAFLVMGVAYLFGTTGSTRFDAVFGALPPGAAPAGAGLGLLLVLVGVGFKVAMVPFHLWAPDVYQGAPNSITAFLSIGSKAGGLILLLRLALHPWNGIPGGGAGFWLPILSAAAVLSLLLGNLAAIPQRNLKRLLGYSSIGHTGFILVAVAGAVALRPDDGAGVAAVNIYLLTYFLATFSAFIVLTVLERHLPGLEIHHLAGLAQRSPLLAAALAVALVSLAGVPPLGGFVAKALVVLVAWNHQLYLLLGVTLFAAVAALFYYLGPLKAMYWSEPLDRSPLPVSRPTRAVLAALMILTVATGIWVQAMAWAAGGAILSGGSSPAVASVRP